MWKKIGFKPASQKPLEPKHYKLYSPPQSSLLSQPNTLRKFNVNKSNNSSFSNLNDSKFFIRSSIKEGEPSLETDQQDLKYKYNRVSAAEKEMKFNEFRNRRSSNIMNETTIKILNMEPLKGEKSVEKVYSKQEYDILNQKYIKSLKQIESQNKIIKSIKQRVKEIQKELDSLKYHSRLIGIGVVEELKDYKQDIHLIVNKLVEEELARKRGDKVNQKKQKIVIENLVMKNITTQHNNQSTSTNTNNIFNNTISKQLANLRSKVFDITQLNGIFSSSITHYQQQNTENFKCQDITMNQIQTVQSVIEYPSQILTQSTERLSH